MSHGVIVDGTWDIETEGWDRFVMGGVSVNGETEVFDDSDRFFERLMALPKGTYWAHNGGRFDHLWLIEHLLKAGHDWTGALRGSSVIEVSVDGRRFRDSYAVFPESLSIVAQAGGAEKIDVGLPCVCHIECNQYCSERGIECKCPRTCGGYCSIRHDMEPALKRRLTEYLVADCEGLQAGLLALQSYCERNDIDLRSTIGASAWTTCARWVGLDTKRPAHSPAMYRAMREGYYGGRNEGYGLAADSGNRYDQHSCYPAALSFGVLPTGEIRSANPSRAYASGFDGVYKACVTVPECFSPPLPMRTKDRLVYCHGPISGTWTGLELRHAESTGARIDSISEAIYCEQSEGRLKPYADRVWELREHARIHENDGIYRWVKWLANSLTGKLAMLPSVVTLACVDEDAGMKPGETRILHKHGRVVVSREAERVGSCAHVEWAAHLTAFARTEVHRQLLVAGEEALYCDTDSVYTRGTLTRRVGDNLGEWGHEGAMLDWQCLALKLYRYWEPAKQRYVTRGKGMSKLHPVGFDALRAGRDWTVNSGVNTLKTAIAKKGRIFTAKSLSRGIVLGSPFIGSRRKVGIDTEAVTFGAYELACGARVR